MVKNWRFDVPGWRLVVEIAPPLVFLSLAIPCVRATAHEFDEMARRRGGRGAASSIRVITTMVGYVVVLFLALGLTDYPLGHLLLGGAILGVILGIAAQQSLGNVFAGLVLLAARPFTVGNTHPGQIRRTGRRVLRHGALVEPDLRHHCNARGSSQGPELVSHGFGRGTTSASAHAGRTRKPHMNGAKPRTRFLCTDPG